MGETNIANGSWQLAVGFWQNHQPQRAQRFLFCLLIFEKIGVHLRQSVARMGLRSLLILKLPDYSITNSSSASSANFAVNGFGFALGLILIFLICVICANQWRKKILLLILKLLNYPITQFSICLLSLGLDFSHRIERYVDLIDVDVSRRNGHLVENSTAQVTRAVVIIGGKRVSSRVPRDHLHKILSRHGPAQF